VGRQKETEQGVDGEVLAPEFKPFRFLHRRAKRDTQVPTSTFWQGHGQGCVEKADVR
jgi:hypothetical protein